MFESLDIYERLPEIYNKLPKEYKCAVDGYTFAIEDAGNRNFIIDDMVGNDDSILGQMKAEIANETIDAILAYMETQRQEMILSFFDSMGDE